MKIKLKDITEEQYNKWKEEKCKSTLCKNCIFNMANCSKSYRSWVRNKEIYSDKFLNQEIEIEDEEILTDEEKKYLENVIRPFKDKVEYIRKVNAIGNEYIKIDLFNDDAVLPYFEFGKYYKGMETSKEYTLEELGLFKE